MDMMAALVLIIALFAVLGAGMWIGLGLLAVGLIGMGLFTSRPVGEPYVTVDVIGSRPSEMTTFLMLAPVPSACTLMNGTPSADASNARWNRWYELVSVGVSGPTCSVHVPM